MTAKNEGNNLILQNRPPENLYYSGPGIAYFDPTAIYVTIDTLEMTLEAYIQSRQDRERTGANEDQRTVEVNQQNIDGKQVVRVDENNALWGTTHYYVVTLEDEKLFVLTVRKESAAFAERLLETLEW